MDQCYQKEAEQGSITASESPFLGRQHHVPPPPSSDHCNLLLKEQMCVETHLSFPYAEPADDGGAPVQLRSIRVAMVCEKTEMNVAVRFPSMESLRAFFNYSKRETHPALDEKFVVEAAVAEKVLVRLIPAEVFSEQKSLEAFWLISSSAADSYNDNAAVTAYKKGTCLSELKGNGMVRWGIRRQVKYLGRHREIHDGNDVNAQNSSSSFVNGVGESQMELGVTCDERESIQQEKTGDSDDGGINGVNEDDEEEEKIKTNKNLKRKRYSFRNIRVKKPKKQKLEIRKQKQKQKQKQKKNEIKKSKGRIRSKEAFVLRDPKDRWSAERYKLAEQNLLGVMKAKGATAEKPILRPQLRAEARKRIGDTGLLDHLLKHMAGKLAPGGEERFRRRHNPDGAMEYWLESADLVNIRRDAGVADPYWVPPPGWKPGDSPTQDPICARELKLLKDDISKIKRDLELMVTKVKLEEEVGKLRRELEEISSKKRQDEIQASKIASSRSDISQKLDQLATSLSSSRHDLDSPVLWEKCKEQLMTISDFVREIENWEGRTKCGRKSEKGLLINGANRDAYKREKTRGKRAKEQTAGSTSINNRRKETSELGKDQNKGRSVAAAAAEAEKTAGGSSSSAAAAAAAEEKAAKIQRLKSGFRICKPQGTFLWPNMVKDNNNINSSCSKILSPQVVVQVEVPTPPSVSSSTASAPPQLPYTHSPSVVKPLAEKRAVTVTVSSIPNHEDGAKNYSTTTTASINLNDAPSNPNVMPLLPPTAPWESSAYGARNVMGYEEKGYNACCSSSATSLPSQVGNWLALNTLKSASDDTGNMHG
ncbi:UNVERIFIED_CONTAM: protein DYAD [Sesamum calycinum]|uniref:Protein DYAD n=1 Tax=Sesamum calycinum TaxID=2727403 RepID=A0AAW2JEA1_9LAMI